MRCTSPAIDQRELALAWCRRRHANSRRSRRPAPSARTARSTRRPRHANERRAAGLASSAGAGTRPVLGQLHPHHRLRHLAARKKGRCHMSTWKLPHDIVPSSGSRVIVRGWVERTRFPYVTTSPAGRSATCDARAQHREPRPRPRRTSSSLCVTNTRSSVPDAARVRRRREASRRLRLARAPRSARRGSAASAPSMKRGARSPAQLRGAEPTSHRSVLPTDRSARPTRFAERRECALPSARRSRSGPRCGIDAEHRVLDHASASPARTRRAAARCRCRPARAATRDRASAAYRRRRTVDSSAFRRRQRARPRQRGS